MKKYQQDVLYGTTNKEDNMYSKTWYKCEPNKNKECNRRSCRNNQSMDVPSYVPICKLTSKIEYSIDGIPLKVLKSDDGFKVVKA